MQRHLLCPRGALTAVLLAVLTACTTISTRTETTTETKLLTDHSTVDLVPGSFVYVRTGLIASAAAPPDDEAAMTVLGQRAMDKLVAAARLRRNQALVNMTMERGVGFLGRDMLEIVTLRADVIEFRSNNMNPPEAAPAPAPAPGAVPAPTGEFAPYTPEKPAPKAKKDGAK